MFSALAVVFYYLFNKPVNRKKLLRNFIVYSAGVSSVYALASLVLILQGAFDEFWFWCYEFPKVYVSELTLSEGVKWFYREFKGIVGSHLFFWITGALGSILIWFTQTDKYKKIFICLFALFSCMTIVPGLYFSGHYWIQLLPALCLLIGVSFYFVKGLLSKFVNSKVTVSVVFGIFVIAVGRDITNQREYYFNPDYTKILRQVYNGNPFPESIIIADFIKERTTKTDTIALIGSEPQVYFYADRRCPSKHSYFEYLVFGHPKHVEWQKEFMSDIEKAMPKYMVLFFHRLSLMGDPNADMEIYTRFFELADAHYRVVGVADMAPSGTVYVWNEDLEGFRPKGPHRILIYERK